LAQGIALDIERLPGDFVVRTKLGEIAIILARVPGGFAVRCERSYGEWLAAWLARAVALTTSTGDI